MSEPLEKLHLHYGVGGLLDSILRALSEMGKDPNQLRPEDLASIDEFHSGGRKATEDLAHLANPRRGCRVLDVGCGLGGPVRYLAEKWDCQCMGLDITAEYVEAAKVLTGMVGLSAKAEFLQGSALELPFDDGSFEVVWTQHAQMNIADKGRFYSEITRVLQPGGRFVFYDVLQGEGGEPYYPLPWANDPSMSFLATGESLRGLLRQAPLSMLCWEDRSRQSLEWFAAATEERKRSGRSPLGLHLLMGKDAKVKSQNLLRNLQEKRVTVLQGLAEKPCAHSAL